MWTLLGRRAWPLFALLAACGGGDFSSLPEGNGGAGPSGQGVDAASAGPSGTQAGPSGSMNSGPGGPGSGGGGPDPCANVDCQANEYCSQSTGMCVKCADLDNLQFDVPEKLSALNGGGFTDQRFPRGTHNPTEMLFRTGAPGDETQLHRSTDFMTDAGSALGGVDLADIAESGPLEAPGSGISILGDSSFFWDGAPLQTPNQQKIFGGIRNANVVTSAGPLPVPINTEGGSWSFARAGGANRAWWMTNRNGEAELLTVSLENDAAAMPATVMLVLPDGCERRGTDATPWVNAAGTVMLFRALEHDPNACQAGSKANDVFAVPLDPATGQATGSPIALPSVPGADDTDPSMSLDMCWLYFSSDEGSGEYDVFRARRR